MRAKSYSECLSATTFDTLTNSKKLREAGVPEALAEVHAEALRAVIDENLATKSDIELVFGNFELVRKDTEMIHKDIELVRRDVLIKLGGIVVAGVSVLAALIGVVIALITL